MRLLLITALAATISAAPLARPQSYGSHPPPPGYGGSGTPPPNSGPNPTAGVYEPTVLSNYDVNSGSISYDTETGIVVVTQQNGGQDISTLFTFDLPTTASGKTCSWMFDISGGSDSAVDGSMEFDLFTSLKPATQSTTGFPPGNQRNQYVGRMLVDSKTLTGAFIDSFSNSFPCPVGTNGFEMVGVNTEDIIYWSEGDAIGLYLQQH